jgi:cytochrome c oxidase subunit II
VVGKPSREARGRARRATALVGTAVLLPVVLAGCSLEDAFHLGWPRTKPTEQSELMMDLWIGSTVAALAVGVIVWGLTFWCVVAYRKRNGGLPPQERLEEGAIPPRNSKHERIGEDSILPPQTRYNLPAELAFTGIPFVLIGALFYFTVVVQNEVTAVSEDPNAVVEITAFKWNWQFTYTEDADGDGTFEPLEDVDGNVVTETGTSDYIPIIVVPATEKVQFVGGAQDVIHSFWVPDLLFKRDVFPGGERHLQTWEVDFTKEGEFVGRCAELCGAYHAFMNFEMRVVSEADYEAFLDARAQGLTTPEALESIGHEPYAIKTNPFGTDPTSREAS